MQVPPPVQVVVNVQEPGPEQDPPEALQIKPPPLAWQIPKLKVQVDPILLQACPGMPQNPEPVQFGQGAEQLDGLLQMFPQVVLAASAAFGAVIEAYQRQGDHRS